MSAKVDARTCAPEIVARARGFYEAYIANCDGLAWNGTPCPTWDGLNDAVRSHWCAVALHSAPADGARVVDAMTAAEIADLDEGIRDTVLWLRMHGFETVDSGDGYSKIPSDEEIAHAERDRRLRGEPPSDEEDDCALEVPNVAMTVAPAALIAECNRLRRLIESVGADVGEVEPEGDEGIAIQGSYDPANGSAIIVLLGFVLPSGSAA